MMEIRAFGTPTVVHLGAALLISAIMSAPMARALSCRACPGRLRGGGSCLRSDGHQARDTPYGLHAGC